MAGWRSGVCPGSPSVAGGVGGGTEGVGWEARIDTILNNRNAPVNRRGGHQAPKGRQGTRATPSTSKGAGHAQQGHQQEGEGSRNCLTDRYARGRDPLRRRGGQAWPGRLDKGIGHGQGPKAPPRGGQQAGSQSDCPSGLRVKNQPLNAPPPHHHHTAALYHTPAQGHTRYPTRTQHIRYPTRQVGLSLKRKP